MQFAARGNHRDCLKTLKLLGANCAAPSWLSKLDEDESGKLRYRVYFMHSLVSRLLFVDVQVQHHRRLNERAASKKKIES